MTRWEAWRKWYNYPSHGHSARISPTLPQGHTSSKCPKSRSIIIPPSHRRCGATAVLVRHKPQWHRHDRRSTVVPSLIVVAPRKTVKTADLRGGTAATLNMFRRASAVLVPSHRRRGATAVFVRHKPQWHRHDRRGSAVVPSVIAVAPRKTVKTADLRGGTAETWTCSKLPQTTAGKANPQWDRRDTAMTAVAPPWPPWYRTRTAVAPPSPPCLRSTTAVQSPKSRMATLRRSRGGSTAVNVWRVGETFKNYWRCHYGDGGLDQNP